MTVDLDVWRDLTSRFAVDLFCGWFLETSNEGIQIAPTTLGAFAKHCVPLSLDIYGPLSDPHWVGPPAIGTRAPSADRP